MLQVRLNKLDDNSYSMLMKKFVEPIQCEFCDATFSNRYASIIHNSYHIVIPLIKQKVHQCPECLYYFQSLDELNDHKENKHTVKRQTDNTHDVEEIKTAGTYYSDIFLPFPFKITNCIYPLGGVNLQPKHEVTEEYILPDVCNLTPQINNISPPQNIISHKLEKVKKNEPQMSNDHQINNISPPQNIQSHKQEILKNSELQMSLSALYAQINNISQQQKVISHKPEKVKKNESQTSLHNNGINNTSPPQKIISNKELQNSEVQMSLSTLYEQINNISPPQNIISHKQGKRKKSESQPSPSVHYDELIVPGIYRCKYCNMQFPNKFKSIEHEVIHMQFKKGRALLCTVCDMYIAGNHWQLKKHIAEKHPLRTDRPRSKSLCNMCGLKYHKYVRHMINYHPDIVGNSEDSEGGKLESNVNLSNVNLSNFNLSNVNHSCFHRSVFNICQGCMPFLKKKINLKYVIVGSVNKIGTRHKCAKCKRLFFEVNLIKRIQPDKRSVDKLRFEEDLPKRKAISNKDRLRNIQQRLKMINKLSKF